VAASTCACFPRPCVCRTHTPHPFPFVFLLCVAFPPCRVCFLTPCSDVVPVLGWCAASSTTPFRQPVNCMVCRARRHVDKVRNTCDRWWHALPPSQTPEYMWCHAVTTHGVLAHARVCGCIVSWCRSCLCHTTGGVLHGYAVPEVARAIERLPDAIWCARYIPLAMRKPRRPRSSTSTTTTTTTTTPSTRQGVGNGTPPLHVRKKRRRHHTATATATAASTTSSTATRASPSSPSTPPSPGGSGGGGAGADRRRHKGRSRTALANSSPATRTLAPALAPPERLARDPQQRGLVKDPEHDVSISLS